MTEPRRRRTRVAPEIATMFPRDARVATGYTESPERPLGHEETRSIARAVPKRQQEFRAGRACAHRALRALGVHTRAIPAGPDRAPVWPIGVVGSITHTDHLCAAVVGFRERFFGLGVDVEHLGALSEDRFHLVRTDLEGSWLAHNDPLDGIDWPTFLFSAKESFFKSLYPALRGRILDFKDAAIVEAPKDGRFEIELVPARRSSRWPQRATGSYSVAQGHLATGVAIPVFG